jgi:hypothetical protein
LVLVVCVPVISYAQYGTVPSNYYPEKYNGSIFTGVVTETGDDEIVLNYTKGSKTEVFKGRFETGCSVPRADKSGRKLMPPDIPKGTSLTVFFNSDTKKANGTKVKENVILAIAFDSVQGQKISDDKKMIYPCTKSTAVHFRAY